MNSAEAVSEAFSQNGAQKNIPYALGLIIPAGLEKELQGGSQPQTSLYVNGDAIREPQAILLERSLEGYVRRMADPHFVTNIRIVPVNPTHGTSLAVDFKKFLAMVNLVSSLFIGASFVSSLLVEEMEKKTIHLLRGSSAAWIDMIWGKLLIGLGYQLLVAIVILVIQNGFVGQVRIVLLLTLLGAIFSVAVGLLAGSLLKTGSAVGAFVGVISLIFLLPAIFAGFFFQVPSTSAIQLVKVMPTYYLAEGILNAMMNQTVPGRLLMEVAVVAGYTLACLAAAVWSLRLQKGRKDEIF